MNHKHGGDIYSCPGCLDFSANLNPLGIPLAVIKEAKRGVELSAAYPDVACRKLRQAIAADEGLEEAEIICGNGAAELIFSLCIAVAPKTALLLKPTFAEYEQALSSLGTKIVRYDLKESNDFCLKTDLLEQVRSLKPDIMFLCNPNNPTGQQIDYSFLAETAKACEETGTYFILDECFLGFLDEPEKATLRKELRSFPHLFVLRAFTKLYAMAGLRLGYGLSANQDLLALMRQAVQPWNVSIPAQLAGVAALKETDYVLRARELVRQEKQYLLHELRQGLAHKVYGSAANFIFFKAEAGLLEWMKAKNILIRDCSNYIGLEPGYYRIAIRTHGENAALVRAWHEWTRVKDLQL